MRLVVRFAVLAVDRADFAAVDIGALGARGRRAGVRRSWWTHQLRSTVRASGKSMPGVGSGRHLRLR